jgi:hypothetical protein
VPTGAARPHACCAAARCAAAAAAAAGRQGWPRGAMLGSDRSAHLWLPSTGGRAAARARAREGEGAPPWRGWPRGSRQQLLRAPAGRAPRGRRARAPRGRRPPAPPPLGRPAWRARCRAPRRERRARSPPAAAAAAAPRARPRGAGRRPSAHTPGRAGRERVCGARTFEIISRCARGRRNPPGEVQGSIPT